MLELDINICVLEYQKPIIPGFYMVFFFFIMLDRRKPVITGYIMAFRSNFSFENVWSTFTVFRSISLKNKKNNNMNLC